MSTSTFDDTLSSFIDHYILLLAARFKAPLDVVFEDETDISVYGCTAAEAHSRWDLVARCVQDELSRPRTPEEAHHVKHLDVFFFTGDICRERALYLQWKMQSTRAAAKHSTSSSSTRAGLHQGGGARPSTFDVTRNSLSDRVAAIFADVRHNLPSALLGLEDSDDDLDEDINTGADVGAHRSAGEKASVATVRDVFVPTEKEKQRDVVLARARDNLLSQVQALQAKFYEQHRRWIDVPYEALELKPQSAAQPGARRDAAAEATPSAADGVARRQSEEMERAALMAALRSDTSGLKRGQSTSTGSTRGGFTASPLEQLRQSVHVDRPARPSEMSEAAIAAMYNGAAIAVPSFGTDEAAAKHVAASVSTAARGAAVIKETAAPTGRHRRWQIMEYEEDPVEVSDEGDD